jgi:AAA domain
MNPYDDRAPLPDRSEPVPGSEVPSPVAEGKPAALVDGQPTHDEEAPVAAPGVQELRVERYVPQSLADLRAAAEGRWDWLWQGYLGPGNVTLLTSLWKSGKSTLISVLLARMKTGGTVAGLPVRAGRAVVISEEPPKMWLDRSKVVDLDGHIDWFCRPFRGKPTDGDWQDLLARVVRLHEEKGVALLVIDSLANLSPMRSENDAVQMLDALKPLQALTSRGVASLVAHHPKKGPTVPGQAARGSGALLGYVDIIVEMQAVSAKPDDRRRRLRAYSRHAATPARLVLAWTADGTDYVSLGGAAELDFEHGWPVLQGILEQAEAPLTRRTILGRWPDLAAAPAKATVWKWLDRAVKEGRVLQEGRGTRAEPFLYQLPGMVEKWHQEFLATFMKRLESDPAGSAPPPPP